ncbi:MAG: hypothetical protein HRT41_10915 [Campylobacteraceae bacterium]|nr:hypothetical protein [Campylobacteraceae bacterium]
MDEYQSIACHFYDELEEAAVKKVICTIVYQEEDEKKEIKQKIVDLKIIDKAEYMILENAQKIRLDKILLFNNLNPNDNKFC